MAAAYKECAKAFGLGVGMKTSFLFSGNRLRLIPAQPHFVALPWASLLRSIEFLVSCLPGPTTKIDGKGVQPDLFPRSVSQQSLEIPVVSSESGTVDEYGTESARRTRAAHNIVEKQYRTRLNAKFEGLLNAMLMSPRTSSKDHSTILKTAEEHIRTLEGQCSELTKERDALLAGNSKLMELVMEKSKPTPTSPLASELGSHHSDVIPIGEDQPPMWTRSLQHKNDGQPIH